MYDEKGVCGIVYNTCLYVLERDFDGSIAKILSDGRPICEYHYDAWGNCSVDINTDLLDESLTENERFVINNNPFRWKGYYYDVETELYYCNYRYYSPLLCSWISPDSLDYLDPSSIDGLNLYCYCYNNPVMYVDPSGHSAILIGLIIGAIVGAGVGFGTAAYIDYKDDGQVFNGSVAWYDYLGSTVLGGVLGAGIGAGIGAFAGMSFSASFPTFGWINSGGSFMFGVAGATTLTFTGAQALEIAGLLGVTYLFASNNRPGNNRAQNKQFEQAARAAGYNTKDPRVKDMLNEVHQYIRKKKLNLGWKELLELIREWLG